MTYIVTKNIRGDRYYYCRQNGRAKRWNKNGVPKNGNSGILEIESSIADCRNSIMGPGYSDGE